MEVIIRGIVDKGRLWRGHCPNCGSYADAYEYELKNIRLFDLKEGEWAAEICPVCNSGKVINGEGGMVFRPIELKTEGLENLTKIMVATRELVDGWCAQRGEILKSPYRGDNPCFSCDRNEFLKRTQVDKCTYCIHNADNILMELINGALDSTSGRARSPEKEN